MSDYLQRYLPEFDEDAQRQHLEQFSKRDLLEMVLRAYKEKRLLLKMLGERDSQLAEIQTVLERRSALLDTPGVPSSDDLRRMMDDDPPQEG